MNTRISLSRRARSFERPSIAFSLLSRLAVVVLMLGLALPLFAAAAQEDAGTPSALEELAPVDTDGDGVADDADNCPAAANADQADADGDGSGDACDDTPNGDPTAPPVLDADGDGVADDADNCPAAANADQADADGDGSGDACDDTPNGDPTPEPTQGNGNGNGGKKTAAADTRIQPAAAPGPPGPPDGGDISIDWIAAGPDSYNHSTGAIDPQFGYDGRIIDREQTVESLEGGDYACGDIVYFFAEVDVSDDPAKVGAGASTVQLTNEFSKVTTSGGLVGFGELVGDPVLGNSYGDTGYTGDGDETITGVSTATSSATKLVVALSVTGVEAFEEIIVRYAVRLVCGQAPGQVTGNIQTSILSASVTAGGTGNVSVGNQTVPLKSANNIRITSGTTLLFLDLGTPGPGGGDQQLADGAAISTGDKVFDTMLLTGLGSTATGTVTYTVYTDSTCTTVYNPSGTPYVSTVNVAGTLVAPSATFTFNQAGTFEFRAVYSGDLTHAGASSTCGTETLVVNAPSLTITKTADAASVNAGEPIGFTVTVVNSGLGVAFGVDLSDDLPDGPGIDWSIDSQSPAGTCAIVDADAGPGVDQQLDCVPRDLAGANPGDSDTLTVHVVSPTTGASCGTYDNTASFTSTNGGSGSDGASTTVQCPDLSVTKTAEDDTVSAGEEIAFVIEVSNAGPGTAFDVTLTDALPGGTGIDWAIDALNSDAGCVIDGAPPTETLNCDVGDLAVGASFSVRIVSDTTFDSCATYVNTATADASNHDEVESVEATITVQCPDLVVEKEPDLGDPGSVINTGELASFTVTVTNNGPGTAFDVTLTDTLPAGEWDVAIPAGVTCVDGAQVGPTTFQATGSFSCDLGDLADNASVEITVSRLTEAADCGTLTNTATADASNDNQVSNSGQIQVNCPASISTAQTLIVYPNDSATLTGLHPQAGGTLAFQLWDSSSCDGNLVYEETVAVLGGGTYFTTNDPDLADSTAAEALPVSAPGGTWYWLVTYSGDPATNTSGASIACGEEQFTITIDDDVEVITSLGVDLVAYREAA